MIIVQKVGTITIDVFRKSDNTKTLEIQSDSDDILPVSYVIEDTLKKY